MKAHFQGHDAFIPKTRKRKGPINYQWLSHIAIISWLSPPIQSWFSPWDFRWENSQHFSGAGSMEIEPSKAAAWRTGVGCSDFLWWFDDCIYRYEIYINIFAFSYVVSALNGCIYIYSCVFTHVNQLNLVWYIVRLHHLVTFTFERCFWY